MLLSGSEAGEDTLALGVSFCLRPVSTVYALHGSGDQLMEWRARQKEEANPSGKTRYMGCRVTTKSEGIKFGV